MTTNSVAQRRVDLQQALSFHEEGQLEDAQRIYEGILAREPGDSEAATLLGAIALQQGEMSRALEWCSRALERDPSNPVAWCNSALAYSQLGQHSAALERYERVIALDCDVPDIHLNHGNALAALERFEAAVTSYGRAIQIEPDYAEAHERSGYSLARLRLPHAALASYDRAIELLPDFEEAHLGRGSVLVELKRFEEALASFDQALAYKPDYAEACFNRGIALIHLGRYQAAVESFDGTLAVKPDYAEAYSNLGVALRELERWDAALASFEKAIALSPRYAAAHSNKGNVLLALQRWNEALESYEKAIACDGGIAEPRFNSSIVRLLHGNFERGWLDYEWRREMHPEAERCFAQPRWSGAESIEGKTILLHGEQGLGDTLQFCRYTNFVAKLGACVILEVSRVLTGVLAMEVGVSRILAKGEVLPPFDYHCSLMSLPLAFKTRLDNIPSERRYLHSDANKIAHWRDRLGPKTRPRIGLVWSGNTGHKGDRQRSIALAQLCRHLPTGAQYVSLQKDVRDNDRQTLDAYPQIQDWADELCDFSDTAALCECMDLVVSVDTSVAHLSAGLGKRTWILLPWVPDWRWLLDRDDSPWYPTARLYRQASLNDWDSVLQKVATDMFREFQ